MRKDEFPIIDKHVQNEINAVLTKIKAEIDEKISHYEHFASSNTANGLTMAKKIIEKYEPERVRHDGCDGCAHIDDGFDEEPCKWCRYNYEDKWESKDA